MEVVVGWFGSNEDVLEVAAVVAVVGGELVLLLVVIVQAVYGRRRRHEAVRPAWEIRFILE